MIRKFSRTILSNAALGAAAVTAANLALRPWFLRWGATDGEVEKNLPGDELCPDAESVATRAVTVHAPAEAVWPWINQIGQDRGGFYSYSWLENLAGARIHNASSILPGLQTRAVGETVWMATPEHYRGQGCMRVAKVEPGRSLVLVSPADYEALPRTGLAREGVWAFVLEPVDEHTTRLLVRSRSGLTASPGRILLFDPIHFIMERKMMLGIRERAEAGGYSGISPAAAQAG